MILKALAVAMGVAVIVLSNLHLIETESCFTMLGIGLTCVGVCLRNKKDAENGKQE